MSQTKMNDESVTFWKAKKHNFIVFSKIYVFLFSLLYIIDYFFHILDDGSVAYPLMVFLSSPIILMIFNIHTYVYDYKEKKYYLDETYSTFIERVIGISILLIIYFIAYFLIY